MSLKRDSPVTLHGGRGVAAAPDDKRSADLPVARGGGGVSRLAPDQGPHRRQDFVRYKVQEDLSPQASPGAGATPVPATVGAAVAAAQAQQAAAARGGGISAVPTATTTTTTTAPTRAVTGPAHVAAAGPAAGPVPAGRTHGEPGVEYRSAPELYSDKPGLARESREMLPGTLDMPSPVEVEKARVSADNTAGYDAGTAARGGGTGGTTEAMTGGLAAGGAIGDERRQGLGDIAQGQL